ncbi:hypothetical protein [Nonomuraea roseoviolacea]|uniref:Chitin-binding type-3 domain-containing protein n=1 Tax=Nonomuraea roseoviolacea subsp. carminata TaxID=160689 RepID=A0ABT1JV86_9ACTN|nr:hypothetical protein [Nonomuraea roseoviolacea]MCP2345656.1 hypothetical protein [Nonomuraea roseoviolacea subsp. carminata]
MRLKRGIVTAALAAGLLALGSTPAHAIPPPPPGGDLLTVISYWAGDTLVGQRWFGCNQTGQWGTQDGQAKVSWVAC